MVNGKKDEELKYTEVPTSKPLVILWDTIQSVIEGVIPGYDKAARALEKSRKRVEGKE